MGKKLRLAAMRLWKDIQTYKALLLALLFYDAVVQICFGAFCPMVIVTGLPCPGCGMTRAVCYLLTGQFAKSWEMHPMGILWTALAVCFLLSRYWFAKPVKALLRVGGVLAVCMLALYLYRMYRCFPGEAPMAYHEKNLLERALPGYRDLVLRLSFLHKGKGG